MQHPAPYTPQQNGVVERKNRSLKYMATYLLEERDITPYLWAEAVKYASYIHNRIPHKLVVGVTPFKEMMGHKPNVSHLRDFVSKSWAIIPSDMRKSFQPQSSECIMLGYEDDAKYYKLMEIATGR